MRGRLEKKAPNNNLTHQYNHPLYLPGKNQIFLHHPWLLL